MRDSDLDRPEQDLDAEVLKRALHAVNNLVVITDPGRPDNPVVWVNDFFCSFTGYDRDEVIGRGCLYLFGAEAGQPALRALRTAVVERRYARLLLQTFRKDGTSFCNDLHVSPVPADVGGTEYFVWLMNDVTDLEEALATVRTREREVKETAEHERERFGMDLHDGLGQTLAGLRMLAAVHHERLEGESPPHAAEAARLVALSDQAAQESRLIARGMNPVDASPEGLGEAIRAFTDALNLTLAGSGLRIEVAAGPVAFVDRRQALHLYRIAQEAVNNAVKHGGAGAIGVTLAATPEEVVLEVRSEGGRAASTARPALTAPAAPHHRGMGHHGMRYRADLIGAAYEAGPTEGGGMAVRVALPLDAAPQHVPTAER